MTLNSKAREIIDAQRGKHDEYVFTFKGKPVERINGQTWRKAREKSRTDSMQGSRSSAYLRQAIKSCWGEF